MNFRCNFLPLRSSYLLEPRSATGNEENDGVYDEVGFISSEKNDLKYKRPLMVANRKTLATSLNEVIFHLFPLLIKKVNYSINLNPSHQC